MAETAASLFDDLVRIFQRLRSPDGCPWDREQTHDSLKRNLLEETHEVLEAIDQRKGAPLADELGDILAQALFHAQIAREEGEFTVEDVLRGARDKLVRRHPHVFGRAQVRDAREVEANWQRLKEHEAEAAGGASILGRVPSSTPALAASQLIQDRASRSGFDWPTTEGVLQKVVEELREIQEAPSPEERAQEFGDLLLALVNVARWLGLHAEDALRQANLRFAHRFRSMERLCQERGLSFRDLPLEEKERLWQEVKARGPLGNL